MLLIISSDLFAQKKKSKTGYDSLQVKGKTILYLNDSSYYIKHDTILYLPDSVVARLRKDRQARSAQGYQKLKDKLSKRRFTKEIYDLLFKDPPAGETKVSTAIAQTDDFDDYEGYIINSISINRLNPFGTRVTDTTRQASDWFSKTANNIHVKTREFVVRNNLFFKKGDEVNPDLLRDSERIIRTLPFIRDARVYIIPKPGTFQVDVLVIARDVWNISGGASYSSPDDFSVTVTDKNFLGLGYELKNELPYNALEDPTLGYIGTYTANNIKNTFITAEGSFARSQNFDKTGIRVFRNFITPDIKYAGGAEIAQERRILSRVFRDTTILFENRRNFQDYWIGRSFLIQEDERGRANLQLAINYEHIDHLDRPVVSRDTNQLFYDSYLKLASIGISKRRFERSSLILGYGRTEDIPIGYLGEITVGRETNEFTNRTYIGSEVSFGNFFDRFGYIRPTLSFGSFIENKQLEQGLLSLELNYFSFLYRIRRTSLRQFINVRYVRGINRFSNEFININDDNGVRGLSNVFLRGTQKIVFNSETVAFTSIFFAGFRMAIFGFADIAFVNDFNRSLFDNDAYQGYGIGLRFRNENLAFNTFQIRLAWYPRTPPDVANNDLDFSGEPSLGVGDFRVNRPQVLRFE